MEREIYFRTRRFERKVGDGEPYQVYWMAVATGNGFSVLEVTDRPQSPNLLMRFLPENRESSIVETRSEALGLEDALSFLDTKEMEMTGRKNTSPVENSDTVGGWHYLSYADRHQVRLRSEWYKSYHDLYYSTLDRFPITLEHLTYPINSPIFSNAEEGILLTPVYHSAFATEWVVYARAVRVEDRWQAQEVQRQITTSLPSSAAPVEKIRDLSTDTTGDFFSAIRALSDWEDVQALTPGTTLFGPEDLSEEQKQRLQVLALRGSYFRVAAERESIVFDVFGRPHLSVRGLVMDEGVFPRFNPEKPEFPSLQRLLRYIESSGPQEESPPSSPSSQEDVLSPERITKALAFYLDHFLVHSGLNRYKRDSGLESNFWRATKDLLTKLGLDLHHSQASPLMVAADFLTEKGNEFVRAYAREETHRLQWRQRLESEQEVHWNRMGKVQSEIAELEVKSRDRAEKLVQQTTALEELRRETAEEKEELKRLREQREFLKIDIRAEAIKEAEEIAKEKAETLRRVMIDFRDATLPSERENADTSVSLRLEFGSLTRFGAIDLPIAFSNIPDKGIKVRIHTYERTLENKPKEEPSGAREKNIGDLAKEIDGTFKEISAIFSVECGAVLWVEGRRGDVARFVKAGGPLERRLKQNSFLHPLNLSSKFLVSVKINDVTYKIPNGSDALAELVQSYMPFSDSVIAARLAPS